MKQTIKKIVCITITMLLIFMNVGTVSEAYSYSKVQYLVINSKYNKVGYFKDGKLVKEFKVATGKKSTPTPQGKFKIVNKIKNRPYYSGGIPGGNTRNPLGDRWLGLHVGFTYGTTYAIHGNNNESSIGNNVSGGCIRMHNKDVRWLFDRIPKGSYAIINYSDKDYQGIASKYGVKLEDSITKQQEKVKSSYKTLYIYGPVSNPTIDLSNKNEIIKTLSQSKTILKKHENGKIYDRQKFLNEWNKLSSKEKQHKDMQEIMNGYKKIISISEAAEGCLSFYENVSKNANTLVKNKDLAKSLNNKDNKLSGSRGKAYKEYKEATKYGENSKNSKRMDYINDKYLDCVYFLNAISYIDKQDTKNVKKEANKIQDKKLRLVINNSI